MAHFYLADGDLPEVGGVAVLEGAEAKHAAAVSRVRVGEQLVIGDGRGTIAAGVVEAASPSRVELRIASRRTVPEPAVRLILVQALAKGDRDELAVQAGTELGVDGVLPWQASRSISRWEGAKASKGVERWRSIVREATKQSMRPRVPEVHEITSTKALVALARALVEAGGRVLVLHPGGESSLAEAVGESGATGGPESGSVALVIGPEGGISPDEIAALSEAGARTVHLGDEVLRTSTAGPAAVAALSLLLGRWD